jgi:hypothetical protein
MRALASNPRQHEPLFDVHPLTGASIEVFYSLETFGRGGAGWFWWPRRCGFSPDGLPTGPFASRYAGTRCRQFASACRGLITALSAMVDNEGRVTQKIGAEVSMRYQRRKIRHHVGEVLEEIFLAKSGGSGRGTRTPDPRIMIPVL